MLTEAVLGPFWAWMFANENPPLPVLVGGGIIIFAVFLQFYTVLIKEKKAIPFHIDDNVNTFIENINFDDQFLSNKDKLLNEQKTFDF